jgi:hypothetical protein
LIVVCCLRVETPLNASDPSVLSCVIVTLVFPHPSHCFSISHLFLIFDIVDDQSNNKTRGTHASNLPLCHFYYSSLLSFFCTMLVVVCSALRSRLLFRALVSFPVPSLMLSPGLFSSRCSLRSSVFPKVISGPFPSSGLGFFGALTSGSSVLWPRVLRCSGLGFFGAPHETSHAMILLWCSRLCVPFLLR